MIDWLRRCARRCSSSARPCPLCVLTRRRLSFEEGVYLPPRPRTNRLHSAKHFSRPRNSAAKRDLLAAWTREAAAMTGNAGSWHVHSRRHIATHGTCRHGPGQKLGSEIPQPPAHGVLKGGVANIKATQGHCTFFGLLCSPTYFRRTPTCHRVDRELST